MTTVEDLKKYFESGNIPNSDQFIELIESMWHKSEKMPLEQIESLVDSLTSKFEKGNYDGNAQDLYDELSNAINEKVFNGAITYPTLADANAVAPFPASGVPMKVAKDGANNGRYFSDGIVWVPEDNDLNNDPDVVNDYEAVSGVFVNKFYKNEFKKIIAPNKNILYIDPTNGMNTGKRISSAGTSIVTSGVDICVTKPTLIDSNIDYAVSGAIAWGASPRAVISIDDNYTDCEFILLTAVEGGFKLNNTSTIKKYFSIDLTVTAVNGNVVNGVAQLEKGVLPTAYEKFAYKLTTDEKTVSQVYTEVTDLNNKITTGKNILKPVVQKGKRISGTSIITDLENLASNTLPIRLLPETTYSLLGSALLPSGYTSPRALFLTNADDTSGTAVTLTEVTGGYKFTTGTEDLWYRMDLKVSSANSTDINGNVQLEVGVLPTTFQNYSEKFASDNKSNNELEKLIGDGRNLDGIYKLASPLQNANKKFPKYFKNHVKRNGNQTVLKAGDSISVRDFHTTYFTPEEQTKRPPLMVSKNIFSEIFDYLSWGNVIYSRFDRASVFTEAGATFVTVNANTTNGGGTSQGITQGNGTSGEEWHDVGDKPRDTRIYTGTSLGNVSRIIPNNYYVYNFIYSTDLKGCENVTVNLSIGNGHWKVVDGYDVNGDEILVEANGYVFSMRHPGLGNNRINSKFQERLKFRSSDKFQGGSFDERATSGTTITFTKDNSDSRFLYWGDEMSKDPYIQTFINSARGGENISTIVPAINDDVYDWLSVPNTTNLVIHEIYLNQGQNAFGNNKSTSSFIAEWENYFYASSNPLSFREKSKVDGVPWQKFECLLWNPVPTFASGGVYDVEPYGFISWNNPTDGMKTILENFLCYLHQYLENYDEEGLFFLNITSAALSEAKAKFGEEWYLALKSSGITGETFFNDSTHPNDYLCKVISMWINNCFDFTYL